VVKKKKATKKKVAKKKVVKPVEPVRPSPFKVGDIVWRPKGCYLNNTWVKDKITKSGHLTTGDKRWNYTFKDTADFHEDELLPESVFHMIATDVSRLVKADFEHVLNVAFDGKASIFAVYRFKQKRPWAYYVFPNGYLDTLCKKETWKDKYYGGITTGHLWITPAAELQLKLLPISSHPREILTYLGCHVYTRLWMKSEPQEQ
jgi:hypothetical protein